MICIEQLRSQSRNVIKKYTQILASRDSKRAFSPQVEMLKSAKFIKNKDRPLSEEELLEEGFSTSRSKFKSTSSEYYKNVYKHRIPLKSYKPIIIQRQSENREFQRRKISNGDNLKDKNSIYQMYDTSMARTSTAESKVAEFIKRFNHCSNTSKSMGLCI